MAIFLRSSGRKLKTRKGSAQPILPDSVHGFLSARVTDLSGAALALSGAALFAALVSYNAADPSFNTAQGPGTAGNWLGLPGSYAADLLMQTLGLAGFILPIALLVWGARVLLRRPVQGLSARVPLLGLAILAAAVALARVPAFGPFSAATYSGGSIGAMITGALAGLLGRSLGSFAALFSSLAGLMVFGVSFSLALDISLGGWARAGALAQRGFAALAVWASAGAAALAGLFSRVSERRTQRAIGRAAAARPRRVRVDADVTAEEDAAEEEEEELQKRAPIVAPRAARPKAAPKPPAQKKLALRHEDEDWALPSIDLLDDHASTAVKLDEGALHKNAEMLQSTLHDFGVEGDIVKVSPGPIVTLYEMEPAPGTKTSRVIGLADDIARSMSTVSVRVAVVPGKNAIGMELPNAKRETVYLKELLAAQDYEKNTAKLPLVLGKNIAGESVIADLARMPHLLVAGTTGSGKSVAVNTMILSLLYRHSPEQCRFIMIDPKMLELSVYDDIPHLLTPVVTEPHRAVTALKWAVREMEDRYRAMSKLGVRNIDGFNERVKSAAETGEVIVHKVQTGFDADTGKPVYEEQPLALSELPYIVIIVDEFADLMLVAGKEVENAIQRLAQMARAAGIHLIMATQRPSVDVITGVIKANFPTRISFQVTSKIDSRTILGDGGAEQLLGQGDMLYMAAGNRIVRVHGPFVSDKEVEKVVKHLRSLGSPEYIEGVTVSEDDEGEAGGEAGGGSSGDDLYDQAVAVVIRDRKVSTSYIQRQLNIGYNRAANIIDRMEREGLITAANHVGKREILGGDHYGT